MNPVFPLVVAVLALRCGEVFAGDQPNIVIILADDKY